MDLEKIVVQGDDRRANLGLKIGSAFAFALLAISGFLIHTGHDWAGVALMGMDLTGVVGSFIFGTYNRRRERETKEQIRRGDRPAKKSSTR